MIKVYSRQNFANIVPNDCAVISLWSTEGGFTNYHNQDLLDDWDNAIRLNFDDIDGRREGYTRFNHEHAGKIIEFALTNRDKDFIIHCDMGVSRSTAVARFLGDYLETEVYYNETGHLKDFHRNAVVFAGLTRYLKFKELGRNE